MSTHINYTDDQKRALMWLAHMCISADDDQERKWAKTVLDIIADGENRVRKCRTVDLHIREQAHELSDAYLRLRTLIPGAFETGFALSAKDVWAHTEAKLNELRAAANLRRGL